MAVPKADAVSNLGNRIVGVGKKRFGKLYFLADDIGF